MFGRHDVRCVRMFYQVIFEHPNTPIISGKKNRDQILNWELTRIVNVNLFDLITRQVRRRQSRVENPVFC